MVTGVSEFPVPKYSLKKSPVSPVGAPDAFVSIAPQTIQTIYGVGSASVLGNSSAGVIEFENQYFAPRDLANFATQFGVKIPPLTADHIIGFNNPNSPQLEATLDIEYVLGTGINALGWFWIEGSSVWLYGFATHLFNTKSVPLVNSISYGWDEEDQCEQGIGAGECQQLGVDSKGFVARVNVEFQKIGARGISLIAASGDSGANGRTDPYCSETHLNPAYPGASPYITAVGATQIDRASGVANLPNPPPGCTGHNCASGGYEECVSYTQANFASGGGFSFVAPTPSYQTTAVANYFISGVKLPPSTYYNAQGRGYPDVAAFGSQVLIISGGSVEPVGGTSCSAPIFAGIVALLNDVVNTKTMKPLGFLNPLLYKMATDCPKCFNDIVTGDNVCTEGGCSSSCKGFYATKGWDPVSGLGTPNYPALLQYVSVLLKFDL